MKRCAVCDSTEIHDTIAELGFNNPITHWHHDKRTDDFICNRCDKEINNFMTVDKIVEGELDLPLEDDDIYLEGLAITIGVDFDEEWDSKS